MHCTKCVNNTPDRQRWNQRHVASIARRAKGGGPATVLRDIGALLADQPGGLALDVGCGLGRNTLHLAELGFAVDAVDVSDVALDEVARRAARCGFAVRTVCANLRGGELPGSGYQVIVDTFFLERSLLPRMVEALAPGGLLLFETFMAFEGTVGPPEDPYVLARGELHAAFADLELVSYSETEASADAYPIARFVARRGPGEMSDSARSVGPRGRGITHLHSRST